MTNICHLLDGSRGWEQRVGLSQLLNRSPAKGYATTLASVDPSARGSFECLDRPIEVCARMAAPPVRATSTATPLLFGALALAEAPRFLSRRRIDLVHAWGVEAAWAARGINEPLIVELFDPLVAIRASKRLGLLARSRPFAVACSCTIVRRRLIEGGLDPDQCVVIRPGVDFSLINECKRSTLRVRLGLAPDEFVVITPEPVARASGSTEVILAVMLISHAYGGIRLIVPGASAHGRMIRRQAATLPRESPLICPAVSEPFESLLAVSDALVVAPCGDLSTTSIAWAFGAGAAVIATATHAVAELVSHKLNGLLFKRAKGKSMVPSIVRALRDRASQDAAKEVARGHAYEVFSLRRCADQHLRLYQNLLAGAAPGGGIIDTAMTG